MNTEEQPFKLWSETHPEVKNKIRRELRWFYFKKWIKSFFKFK